MFLFKSISILKHKEKYSKKDHVKEKKKYSKTLDIYSAAFCK